MYYKCNCLDENCIFCCRKARLEKVKNNNPQPFYIVVYGISRCYGGPHEGGWYWDFKECLDSKRVWSIKQALQTIRIFQDLYPPPKYNRFSVLGGTDIEFEIIPSLDFIKENLSPGSWE